MSSFYSQLVRGTERQALIPPFIAYCSYEESNALFFKSEARDSSSKQVSQLCLRLITGLGLSWAICSYKGFKASAWLKDWCAEASIPVVQTVISLSLAYFFRRTGVNSKYSKDIQFGLMLVAYGVQAYAHCVFEKTRNPSIDLNSLTKFCIVSGSLEKLSKQYIVQKMLVPYLEQNGWDEDSISKIKSVASVLLFNQISNVLSIKYNVKLASFREIIAITKSELRNLLPLKR